MHLPDLTPKVQAKGVEDMVLEILGGKDWASGDPSPKARRLVLKANCKPLGYPTIFSPHKIGPDKEAVYAAQAIANTLASW